MCKAFPAFCITNRRLCRIPFLDQLDRILAKRPAGVILREKDLSLEAYLALGREVLARCRAAGVPCWFHSFPEAACRLQPDGLQLPMAALRDLTPEERWKFQGKLGASCHSLAEVQEAARLGVSCCTFSHIYPTPRPGAAPRSLCPQPPPGLCPGGSDPGTFPRTPSSRGSRSRDDGMVDPGDCMKTGPGVF